MPHFKPQYHHQKKKKKKSMKGEEIQEEDLQAEQTECCTMVGED
jgi:hypothetical protein